MDVIETTKQVGKLIQQDPRYITYYEAKLRNDADEQLQKLIGEFNLKRIELNSEMSKEAKDSDKLKALDKQIKSIYDEIMANENMTAYNDAKDAMDELLAMINNIITASANGEDPETCDYIPHSCSGSCEGCSGCH